jgi:hypothetical protein
MYRQFGLTTRACVLDFYEFLLHAGGSPHLAQGLVSAAVLPTNWSHDRFTLGRALAVRDPELVDAAFLTTLTEQRHARVYTCGTASHTRARNHRNRER